MLLHGKSPREVGKKQRKTTEKHGKSEEKPKFWTKSAWNGLVRGGEKARKAQRKSLEWGFARKSGGQYGVSKLRGWRKEFYCEFRCGLNEHEYQMRRGSHGKHGTHGSWLLYLWTSVASVGGYFSRKVCGFCGFCGNWCSPTDGTDWHRWLGCEGT